MRFSTAYSRPTLTPLGQRLLVLSERKLYDIEYTTSTRDSGVALLRGVLVRETVRSAWSAVDEGREGGLSDWSQTNAMGLDVIGEAEEEVQEDRWFEDLLSELGEEREADDWVPLATDHAATVQVLPAYSEEEVEPVELYTEPITVEVIPPSLESPSPPPTLPITPIDESTHPQLPSLEECDELALPPLLHRSWSSESTESSFDSEEECVTPTLSCGELEDYSGYEWESGGKVEEHEWEEEVSSKVAGYGRDVRGVRIRGF